MRLRDDVPSGQTPAKRAFEYITPRRLPRSRRVEDVRNDVIQGKISLDEEEKGGDVAMGEK